jgi:hypothetical protein
MKIRTYLVIMAATSLGACAAAPPKPAAPPPPEKTVEVAPVSKPVPTMPAVYTQKGVTVTVESVWQSPAGEILGATGTAKNATASNLKFCQVSLAFLGQDGTKLDEAKASTKSLKSGQVWHFQAGLSHAAAASFSSITSDKIIAIPVKEQKPDLASLK